MKKSSRFLSILVSLVMVFSIFTSLPVKAKAETKVPQIDKKALIQKHLKNFKDVDYKKALSQKYGVEVSDDNASSENKVINPDDEVRVIVELQGTTVYEQSKSKKLSISEKKAIEQNIENAQKPVIDKVKYYGKIRHSYKNLLNGFSATVKFKDIDAIRELPNVKKVTVANKYYLDMNSARGITNTETVWQDLGYKGEGMVVAIVDTGIDYTHKDMRLTNSSKAKLNKTTVEGMGGPGHFYTDKVPYGYNFADMNDQVMDLGPGASMHGMHVAGIVAANGTDDEVKNNAAIKGVAPEAQLLAMKVFTNNPDMPSAYSDDIAAAIDDSVKHGADVINMSLGSTAGFVNYDDPEQLAIKNATDMGVTVVVSAGNSYYSTYSYPVAYAMDPDISMVGSPGLFPDTLQVASSENDKITLPALTYKINDAEGLIGYTTSEINPVGVLKEEYELVDCGLGQVSDFSGKDLTGKIALIKRGAITFIEKKLNAQAAGAIGVIVYNRDGDDSYINMATDARINIPSIFISNSDGKKLSAGIASGIKVKFEDKKTIAPNINANQMSDFSSWGTTPDLEFKPEVSAPGGQIYSTVNNNQYETMSGTSMAAPHTSGATALVAQYVKKTMPTLSGKDFVNMVKTLLINSAEPMIDPSTGNKLPYLTRKQGAGVIKTDKAIKTGAYVTTDDGKAVIALKEISGTKEFKLKIKNFSDKDLTFKVVNKYGVLTNYYTSTGLMYPKAAVLNGATLAFNNDTITVAAGKTEEITATITVPSTANNIFAEGYIELQPQTDGQPSLGIPYMGFCGKWSGQDAPRMIDAPMWDYDTLYGITSLFDSKGYYLGQVGEDQNGSPIIDPSKIAFSPDGDGSFDDVMPIVSFMRNAKEFKIQVLDENEKVIREISYDKNIRKNYMNQDFPATYNSNWVWDGTIFNSSKLTYELAPEGNYKIRLLAKPDFENADWYTLDIPVRLDLTPPDFDFDIEKVQGNEFKVKIKNPSNDIQFYGYFVCDKDGKFLWDDDLNVDSNGEATVNLINSDCKFGIFAVDYAGNFAYKDKYIINTSFEVYCPEDCISYEGYPPVETNNSATINFRINEALRPVLDHIGIKVVNAGNARDEVTLTPSETSYKIENLEDGECLATVTLYGKNNNEILATETESFIVDLTPPQITLLNTTGSSIVLTNGEEQYNLQFKVSDMSTGFKVLLNGETVAQQYYNLGSLYENTFDKPVQIKEGENKFTIKAVDLAGHEAVSEVTINSSLNKPVIVANYPQYIGDKKVIVSGNVTYKSGVEITEFNINGEVVQLNGSNFIKELSFDSFGDKSITYYAKAADGTENTFIQNFKLSPINFENRNYKTKENRQTINFNIVQDDTLNDAKLYVSVNGVQVKEDSTTSSSITVENLNDGNNIVEFIIKDKDGNEIVRDYVEIFVEKELPYITAVDDNGNNISGGQIYNNGSVHITGQVNEPVKYLKYKIYGKDNESNWVDIEVKNGLFETTLNLFEGMNRVTFEMEDESGNINSYQAKIWVDITAPVLTIEPNVTYVETDKDEYTIKINVKENTQSYRLYVNENQIDYGESESIEGVEKTIEYKYSVPNGKSNVLIKAVDIVGNTSWYLIEFNKGYTPLDSNFNKNADYEKATGGNIDFNITFNGDKLNSIMYNNKLLKEGRDYTVGDNKITLKEDFLMTLPVGENVLTLNFNSGDYNVVIKVTDSRSTNASLAGIKVDGKVLEGFRADKYEYEYEVNPMLTEPPTVSAVRSDPAAKVDVTQATEVEGTAVIKVTAQDGTVKTYTIKFIIPLKLEVLNNVSQFAKNIDAVIKVKAANISKTLKKAQLIIGLFDSNNKLVNYVAGGYEIKSGEEVVMEGQLKTPNADGYNIKCFIWDILNSQNPLSKVFEFLIK